MSDAHAPVFNAAGEKVGSEKLNSALFGMEFKDAVVHQVVTALQAQSRIVLAHTKGRGEVRGGGKKPWRQKGTGRARHGSRRSPLWAGGGITFGPTKERNYFLRVNRKLRRQALWMVLSDKVKNERFLLVDRWSLTEPKTKQLHTYLQKLPSKSRKTILVTAPTDNSIIRASRNLPNVHSIGVGSLNVVDLLKQEYVIVPKALLPTIEEKYKL